MSISTSALLIALMVMSAVSVEQKSGDKKEMDKLKGTWKAISGESNGEKISEDLIRESSMTITAKEITFITGNDKDPSTYKVDLTTTPKRIDIVPTRGRGKGKALPGIIEVDDDTLKLCLGIPRPKEFSSKPNTGHVLYVYKRVKDTKGEQH